MKKRIFLLMPFIALPKVYALGSASQGFLLFVSLILGPAATVNEGIAKLALWAILFGAMIKGFNKIFEGNHSISKVSAIILSILGIRLMPNIVINNLSKLILVASIIIIPYSIINKIMPKKRIAKIILSIICYLGVYLLISDIGFQGLGIYQTLRFDLGHFYSIYKFQVIIVILLLMAYFSYKFSKTKVRKI
ncbi:MAG: hypothetical protein U9Q69_02170 [Nanoarchaeota archaeon]|nr:hypothetical protein [Nanoarchaeota archaeon]